jgi:hypothetical protein
MAAGREQSKHDLWQIFERRRLPHGMKGFSQVIKKMCRSGNLCSVINKHSLDHLAWKSGSSADMGGAKCILPQGKVMG